MKKEKKLRKEIMISLVIGLMGVFVFFVIIEILSNGFAK